MNQRDTGKGLCCWEWQLIIIIIVSFVCILFEQNKTVFHFVNEKNEGQKVCVIFCKFYGGLAKFGSVACAILH